MGYPESLGSVSYVQMNNNNNEMTLNDGVSSTLISSPSSQDICTSLQQSVVEARREGRITCGVYQAARVLENDPDDVMVCILAADTSQDLELHIHFTLLEAFCWENDIKIIKVDSASKLKKLVYDDNLPANDNDEAIGHRPGTRDVDCVLIQFPKQQESTSDQEVLEFYRASEQILPKPIIELPK
ncbi:growth arrest and DNA damage-inducible protein GADD45 gamma [Lingula anatina]|uniref:Growth arrest and DNA damage-inducible protein GADD45 gamma n=1 Tax=Lingula anatina TaxID=7574 RepID=A0A1S3J7A1_LINAN|nr:growth arrest and DNA damage-inducible protein GADD45 gamma [Lingula anatina]|eukprot:XP_013406188.1 growth arrest and DNA damage-inducible protein GADD45 gamma [Lingula anatina]